MTIYYKRGKIKLSDFKESEHPRDAKGRFTQKGKQAKRKAILELLKKKRDKINLQFFASKGSKRDFSNVPIDKNYPKIAYGFKNKELLTSPHHMLHMKELGYKNSNEYQRGAIDFWNGRKGKIFFSRARQRFYMYDEKTRLLVVIDKEGTIHTFYRARNGEFERNIKRWDDLVEI